MYSGNLMGTLQTVFSLGKSTNRVDIRSNAGLIEVRNNGGGFAPISVAPVVESKSANFTAAYNTIYLVTNSVNMQLPAPVLNGVITAKVTGSNVLTILRAASETIEGVAASFVSSSTRESITLASDGTNWFRI